MRTVTPLRVDLSRVRTEDIRYGLTWARTNWVGYAMLPLPDGTKVRAVVGQMVEELEERDAYERRPAAVESPEPVLPGYSMQGGEPLSLERGTKCRKCGHEIETESERRMAFDSDGRLVDEHRDPSMCRRAKYLAGEYASLPDSYDRECSWCCQPMDPDQRGHECRACEKRR